MSTLLDAVRYNALFAQQVARAISGSGEMKVAENVQNPGDGLLFWPCRQCTAAYIVVPAETIADTAEGVVSCSCPKCAVTTEMAWLLVLMYNLAVGHEMVTPAVIKTMIAA